MVDREGAPDLVNADAGGISFQDVHFGYGPGRAILKGLTFEASALHRRQIMLLCVTSLECETSGSTDPGVNRLRTRKSVHRLYLGGAVYCC